MSVATVTDMLASTKAWNAKYDKNQHTNECKLI